MESLMRVLVISRAAWRNDNNTGNTLSDLFSEFTDKEIFSICMQGQMPNNSIAKQNFCISEIQIINNILKKTEIGKVTDSNTSTSADLEKKAYDRAKKNRFMLLIFLRDLIWSLGKWKNDNLRTYLDEVKPDVIFMPVFGFFYSHKLLKYVAEYTKAKVILFHTDDFYTLRQFSLSPMYWIYRFRLRKWVRNSVKLSSVNYTISQIQKKEYEKCFNTTCKILTKFADFTAPAPAWKVPEGKIKMLYTGNLGLGRWKSLALISDAIEKLNAEGQKIELDIYSATPFTEKMKRALSKNGSHIHQPVSFETVQTLQREADVLVHIEGLSLKSRLAVHQSFSTKLVDYFHMGKCIFAVGKDDEASIKHLIDNGAAVVAQSATEVYEKLKALCERREQILDYGKKAYECGAKHHDKTTMQTMLADDLKAVCENKG